jgi:1-acyl-sn-glycerol-3-phosphate acyltransferase
MIQPDHTRWARFIFNPYLNRLLRNNFSHFYLVNEPPAVDDGHGLIVTPNHFSWWDGFFIDYVLRRYSARRLHIMMLENQLRRYRFFRKLGAYSVDPKDRESITESLRFTAQILNNPGNLVVYYPQGEIQPYDKRPLQVKTGLRRVLQLTTIPVAVVPTAFKIQYAHERRPCIIAHFADPLRGETIAEDFSGFDTEFRKNIDALDRATLEYNRFIDLFK